MIGTYLGSYQLRAELGSGGMATVYRAYQSAMDREVALKVIHAARANDYALRERFRREARLIARLEHPHILPVYDFDGAYEPPYIVMRYLEQGTLRELLAAQQLSLAQVAALLTQIAAALDYAHMQGIVHRDVKPSNILLDRHGNAFVSDFGIARIVGASPDGAITGTGVIIGTPDYIAPEQAQGRADVDGRADVYALGVMLFQMLTGRLPFAAEQPMAVILQHLQAPIPSAQALNPHLPDSVDALLAQALTKVPTARLATAGALAEGFTALLQTGASQGASTLVLEPHTARLEPTPTPAEQQRVVTVVAADAAEYGALMSAATGGDAARVALHALWERGRAIVEQHGGRVVARREHAALCLWGSEVAREDDAEQAIKAAYMLQTALRASLGTTLAPDELLPLAVGIHTGPALMVSEPVSGAQTASGVTITVAERLAAQADGAIRISHDTFRQVRGVFDLLPDTPLRLRGRAEPLETYVVTGIKARAFRVKPYGLEGIDTPFTGREAEQRHLQDAFLTVVEEGEVQIVTIIGEAGMGKSRLLDAFDQWADLRPERFWFFSAQATETTRGRPYALLHAMLSSRFGINDDDSPELVRQKLEQGFAGLLEGADEASAQLIGHLVGFDMRDAPHVRALLDDPRQLAERAQRHWQVFLRRLSQLSPVIITLDDVHHADDASLDLLEQLSREENLPVLQIRAARPSLLERRSARGDERVYSSVVLTALDRRASRELARTLLARLGEVPKDLRDLLAERSAGNPLYLEELVRMLLDERVIVRMSDERWRLEVSRLDHLAVPPTLYALLQTRLDALLAPERLTLQRAAVVGQVFAAESLRALDAADELHLPDPLAPLASLAARGLLELRSNSQAVSGATYGFSQSLMRDLLYSTLLERQRRTYHEAAGRWLEQSLQPRQQALAIAEHYVRAGQPRRAVRWYIQAGELAHASYANEQAVSHYKIALRLLPDDEESRAEHVACYERLGESQSALALLSDAIASYTHMAELADQIGDVSAAARAWNGLAYVLDYNLDYKAAEQSARRALALAEAAADSRQLALALYHVAWAELRSERADAALALGRRALEALTQVDDLAVTARCMGVIGMAYEQLGDFGAARSSLEEALAFNRQVGSLHQIASLLNNLGYLANVQGDYRAALDFLQEGLRVAHESRNRLSEIYILTNLSHALNGIGDYLAAEEEARRGIALCEANGLNPYADFFTALSEACLGQGRFIEAIEVAQQSLEIARVNDDSRTLAEAWRAKGAATAAGGELLHARSYFTESAQLFEHSGAQNELGRLWRTWARAELRSGDPERGRELWARARELFLQHGLEHELSRTPDEPPTVGL